MDGVASDPVDISSTVCQGTVLGPPLLNVFFRDVSLSLVALGAEESKFADDLKSIQNLPCCY